MRQLLFRFALAALAVLAAAEARAELRLKPAITVEGAEIRLADLFEGAAPAAAKVVVAAAPAPGEKIYLRPAFVASLAEQAGLAWRPDPGLRAIAVARAGKLVARETILAALQRALAPRAGGAALDVVLGGQQLELWVPTGAAASVRVEDVDYDPQSGRFSASLAAPADDPRAERVRIGGRVQRLGEVPVLRSRMVPGDVITAADIEWREIRAERIGRAVVTDAGELIGQSPRRPLLPGTPLRATDVQRPELVAKGALVTMVLASPGLTLSATGRAIEAGGEGEVIQVMNVQSRKTVPATIVGHNQVQVSSRTTVITGAGR